MVVDIGDNARMDSNSHPASRALELSWDRCRPPGICRL